jgi:hypothetical protein
MNFLYTTPQGFVHGVRYRDAMLRAWMSRTGRGNSYRTEDVPSYIDIPTNEERSQAEVYGFTMRPLPHGESYMAYLSGNAEKGKGYQGAITTFMGDVLAHVTRITSYRVTDSPTTNERGSFWAIGIDGRTYYGRHNGRGMYCRMRLAKWVDEYDIEQHTPEGWEVVSSEATRTQARVAVREYQTNQPEYAVRWKRRKVKQT